jgi:hypothetical protein
MYPTETSLHDRHAAHHFARQEAQKTAKAVTRKAMKHIKFVAGFDTDLVRDTIYRSAFDEAYREIYQQQLASLIMRLTRSVSEEHLTDLATHACRGLSSLLGVGSEARS